MNHCNELSLTKFIKNRSRRLTMEMVKDLGVDLAKALEYIHEVKGVFQLTACLSVESHVILVVMEKFSGNHQTWRSLKLIRTHTYDII